MSRTTLGSLLQEASDLCTDSLFELQGIEKPTLVSEKGSPVPGQAPLLMLQSLQWNPSSLLDTQLPQSDDVEFFEGRPFHFLDTPGGLTDRRCSLAMGRRGSLALMGRRGSLAMNHPVSLPIEPPKEELSKEEPPMEKPKRPLTAYNVFFRYERNKLVSSTPDDTPLTVESIDIDKSRRRKKRRHLKTHGKIGFFDLTRVIAGKWKVLDDKSRAIFEACAERDKQRYFAEMKQYLQKKEAEATKDIKSNEPTQTLQTTTKQQDTPKPIDPIDRVAMDHQEYLRMSQQTIEMANAVLDLPAIAQMGDTEQAKIVRKNQQETLQQNVKLLKQLQEQLQQQKLKQEQLNQGLQNGAAPQVAKQPIRPAVESGLKNEQSELFNILTTMRYFPGEQAVQVNGLEKLLAKSYSKDSSLAIGRAGGIVTILYAMSTLQNSLVQKLGCDVLKNLAENECNRKAICQQGVTTIVNAMNTFKDNAEVQQAACAALSNLAISPNNRMDIINAGSIHAIVAAVMRFRDQENVFQAAHQTLSALGLITANHQKGICQAASL